MTSKCYKPKLEQYRYLIAAQDLKDGVHKEITMGGITRSRAPINNSEVRKPASRLDNGKSCLIHRPSKLVARKLSLILKTILLVFKLVIGPPLKSCDCHESLPLPAVSHFTLRNT